MGLWALKPLTTVQVSKGIGWGNCRHEQPCRGKNTGFIEELSREHLPNSWNRVVGILLIFLSLLDTETQYVAQADPY